MADEQKIINSKKLVQGAVVLMVALAWSETAKKFIDYIIPNPKGEFIMTLIYAIFITLVLALIVAMYNYGTAVVEGVKNSKNGLKQNSEGGSKMTLNSFLASLV